MGRRLPARRKSPPPRAASSTEAATSRPRARRGTASLAARFAAKEALAKSLGAPRGLRWHDGEVVTLPDGRPELRVTGTVAALAESRGIKTFHVSLSHDAGIASAVVIAEG